MNIKVLKWKVDFRKHILKDHIILHFVRLSWNLQLLALFIHNEAVKLFDINVVVLVIVQNFDKVLNFLIIKLFSFAFQENLQIEDTNRLIRILIDFVEDLSQTFLVLKLSLDVILNKRFDFFKGGVILIAAEPFFGPFVCNFRAGKLILLGFSSIHWIEAQRDLLEVLAKDFIEVYLVYWLGHLVEKDLYVFLCQLKVERSVDGFNEI